MLKMDTIMSNIKLTKKNFLFQVTQVSFVCLTKDTSFN